MSKFQYSKMFLRLDSMAKKIAEKSKQKLNKSEHSQSSQSSSLSSSLYDDYSANSNAAVDDSDIDLSKLIGPNKGKTAQQIIDELDSRYFTDTDNFDPMMELLEALPQAQSQAADAALEARLAELDIIKLLIDKRLSNQVFANYEQFVQGLSLLGDIKDDLFETSLLASDSRSKITSITKELTLSVFTTLQQSQRTARLNTVQLHLGDIVLLLKKENEIQFLLKENEFLQAVSVYQDSLYRLAQSGMNRFTCLDDLRKRSLRSAESINSRAKEQLQLLCKKYSYDSFNNLIQALISMGETKLLSEVLRKSFPVIIEDFSVSSLLPYLSPELIAGMGGDIASIKRMPVKELAPMIDMQRYAACFLTVVCNFTDALGSCAMMIEYFNTIINEYENRRHTDTDSHSNSGSDGGGSVNKDASLVQSFNQARDVLLVHRQELWSAITGHLTTLLTSTALSPATIVIDDFLTILHTGFAFLNLGESFTHLNSDGLKGVLFRKAKDYYKMFAKQSFERMKKELEREEWNALRTSAKFELEQLPELRLRTFTSHSSNDSGRDSNSETVSALSESRSLDSMDTSDIIASAHYEAFLRGENPFRATLESQLLSYDSRSEEKSREMQLGKNYQLMEGSTVKPIITSKLISNSKAQALLRKAALISQTAMADSKDSGNDSPLLSSLLVSVSDEGVILTSSSLHCIKLLGRYFAIIEDVKPLANEAITNLEQLFEFYLYSIFTQFGTEQADFFMDWFEKFPALKKIVTSVKLSVEQGQFGAGVFQSLAVQKPSQSPAESPSSAPQSSQSQSQAQSAGTPTSSQSQSSSSSSPFSSLSSSTSKFGNLGGLKNISKQLNASIASVTQNSPLNKITERNSDKNSDKSESSNSASAAKAQPVVTHSYREERRPHPILASLNQSVRLEDERTMFALRQRCVAIESLTPIIAMLETHIPRLFPLIKPSESNKLREFLSSIRDANIEFHQYLYREIAPLLLPKDLFISKVINVDWTVNQHAERASLYVFSILTQLRANDLTIQSMGGLPYTIERHLYSEVVVYLTESLIEAYSKVKHCSPSGRDNMLLDSQVLHDSIQKLLRLRSGGAPNWSNVTAYIQAYFLGVDDWVPWLARHTYFDLAVIVSLVQCSQAAAHLDRKEQKELLLKVSREWQRLRDRSDKERDEEEERIREEDRANAEQEVKQKSAHDRNSDDVNDSVNANGTDDSVESSAVTESNELASEETSTDESRS